MKIIEKIFKLITAVLVLTFLPSCVVEVNKHPINSSEETTVIDKIESEYVYGTDDVPLFPGLTQAENGVSDFDSVSGNIAVSIYNSKSDLNQIKKFYIQTLPQLGWKLVQNQNKGRKLLYKRNKDSLEINFKKYNDRIRVKFSLSSFL